MTRQEFERLRDLPDKVIYADIHFSATAESSPVLIFDNVRVENSLGLDVRLNGKYNPLLPSVIFNFRILDVGPICRVCVNGNSHNGSRTHKHSLEKEEDPRVNLPFSMARPDLEGKSPRAVWDDLCRRAKIKHVGTFDDP